jgi:hypothetical protein
MNMKLSLSPRLYFSYSQFDVYDQNIRLGGCAWTDEHTAQGFARRESIVNFGTLLEFGYADVVVRRSSYEPRDDYERVIAVPILITSGRVIVHGPEETETGRERNFALPPGHYRLVAAQRVTGDDEEAIDLFFEPVTQPLEQSEVLVADDALDPPTPLIETAAIAGEE